jgi:hypothetical protein
MTDDTLAELLRAALDADLDARLATMRAVDLARAVSRKGISEHEVADILRRHEVLLDEGEVPVASVRFLQ